MCTLPAIAESPVKTNLSTSFLWPSAQQHLLWTFQQYDLVRAKNLKNQPKSSACHFHHLLAAASRWETGTAQSSLWLPTPAHSCWGDRGDPGRSQLATLGFCSRPGNTAAEGLEVKRKEILSAGFWHGGRQPRAALCSPEELHSQRPGMRDLGQPHLMSWRFLPSSSSHHPSAGCCSLQFPGLCHPQDCELSILFEGTAAYGWLLSP